MINVINETFRLPLELDHLIMSFVAHSDEFTIQTIRWKAMLAYSSTCHRFRNLVLPHLFTRFSTNKHDSERGLKDFCHAWMSGDKAALGCAQHITDCFLGHVRLYWESADASEPPITGIYLTSFTSLSNLASLHITLAAPGLDLKDFQRFLQVTSIQSLRISNIMLMRGQDPFRLDYVEELSRMLCNHAITLKKLSIRVPNFMLDLSLLKQAKFQLNHLDLRSSIRLATGRQVLPPLLSAIPSITTLQFDENVGGPEVLSGLSDTDIPHLHTLSCPLSCVPLLVNGLRPICSLELEIRGTTFSNSDVVIFTEALHRSAGIIQELLTLPVVLATSPWSEFTPLLEHISVAVEVENETAFDPSVLPKAHEDVINAIENVGRGARSDTEEAMLSRWPRLSKFEVKPKSLRSLENMEVYSVNLALQRNDLKVLTKRFPALNFVALGLHTRWTLLPDAPGEWKVRVVQSECRRFELMVQRMDDEIGCQSVKYTDFAWSQFDHNSVLAEILQRGSG